MDRNTSLLYLLSLASDRPQPHVFLPSPFEEASKTDETNRFLGSSV